MTTSFEFIKIGPLIDDDLELVLLREVPGSHDGRLVPYYEFEMRRTGMDTVLGSVRLRIGRTAALRFPGHIGYEVREEYRGHRYAARSCRLLAPLARAHGLKAAWFTVDPKNAPSIRTCEIIGARWVDTVRVTKDHQMYAMGARFRRRYRFDLNHRKPGAKPTFATQLPILAKHSPHWRKEFEHLRGIYAAALGPLALGIQHVGSTAVKGLRAKPILDIDIVIPSYKVFPLVVDALSKLGYRHNGDQGIPQREAFVRENDLVPRVSPARLWMNHHLYVCPADSPELRRHIRFRDALRASPRLRKQCEALKATIETRASGDRKVCAEIKEKECGAFFEAALGSDT